MGLIKRLLGALNGRPFELSYQQEALARCLQCETDHDVEYHTCPVCGSQYVALLESSPNHPENEG